MPDDKNLNNGGQGNGGAGAGGNNQQNQNGQGGNGDGAGAGSGGNNSDGAGNGQDQGGKKNDGAGAGEETIVIKKSEWEKTNKDLDTYRDRVVGKKTNEFSLDNNAGGGSGDGAGSGSGAAPALDEKKVREIATEASQSTSRKANEKAATKQFLKDHTDYTDNALWAELVTHLPASINKDDPAAIVDALEGALLLHKRATGKLDEYLKEQADKAKREAEMNAQVNMGFGAGGVGQKSNQGNQTDKPAESTIEMGKKFGHDADELEKGLKEVPKNPEGGFSIDVTKKKK